MPRYGIAPQLSSHWFPQGTPHEVSSHHCGKCMNPFLSGADCSCRCHATPTETRGINRSGDFRVMVGQSDDGNKLGPQTGAQREGKNDE